MARIHLLDESVIHKIAAGEVVQRPASALKELLENSLDAGARRIVVRLERMGKRLLEVEDDGEGMSRNDAMLSIERHATSKIRDAQDLFRVSTLGFRGEALPSIAAVSRMTIRTRRPQDAEGTELILEGGRIRQIRACGMPPGTVVRVRDLFFNTPARRRFMKSDKTEGYHLFRTLYALSLINLHVRIEAIQDGRRILLLPPVSGFEERMVHLWKDVRDQSMIPVEAREGGNRLWGIVSIPPFIRTRGRGIFFFLNRRWITDRRILRAVLSAYRSVAPSGFVPDGVLCLEISPNLVDVNVHPSKFEVRLSREMEVLKWIERAVAEALDVRPNPVRSAMDFGTGMEMNFPKEKKPPGEIPFSAEDSISASSRRHVVAEPPMSYLPEKAASPALSSAPPSRSVIPVSYRILGVLANTYVVAAYDGGLFIVDKHAAHERLIFERLKRSYRDRISTQRCLFPIVLTMDHGEAEMMKVVGPYLEKMGIILEPFGEGTFRVVSLPKWVRPEEAESLVRELLREMSETPTMEGLSERVDKFLATIACHSASRGQDTVSVPEAYALLDQIIRERIPLACPHGRPFIHFLSLKELEKIFER